MLALSIAGVAAVVIAVPAWICSPSGREQIARQIERFVSDEIRGAMTIGSLDTITADGISGRDVRFTDESGRLVMVADAVELDVEWVELAGGHVVSPRGRVRGGQVVLETLASGALTIGDAFESAHPGPPQPPTGADTLRLSGLVVSGIGVRVLIHGAPRIVANHASAILLVRIPENAGAHFRGDRLDGDLRIESPIPIDLRLDDGTIWLDGDARRRASLHLPTRVNGEAVELELVVRMDRRENVHLDLRVAPSSVGAAIVNAPLVAQALLAETTTSALDVTIELP